MKAKSKTVTKATRQPELVVRTGGTLVLEPGQDFVRTDRGLTWGIKVTDTSDFSFVMIFIKNEQGQWASDGSNEAVIDQDFRNSVAAQFNGDVGAWMQQVAVPRINAWLAFKFPAGAPTQSTAAEQADLAIRALRVQMRPDGTLFVAQ